MSENVGKKIFIARCAPCHSIEPGAAHKVGPNLFGCYDRRSAMADGFQYSDVLKAKGNTWNEEALNEFLENPRKYLPGSRMVFAGLKKSQERDDIMAYLKAST